MQKENKTPIYRTDRLPVIYPYHLRSSNRLHIGELVYYGPCPAFYGVGEIISFTEHLCVVNFRGTGELGIFKDVIEKKYLIPIHKLNLAHHLTDY
jgi:hypothetical protein